mgnify:CR=1 FL=1
MRRDEISPTPADLAFARQFVTRAHRVEAHLRGMVTSPLVLGRLEEFRDVDPREDVWVQVIAEAVAWDRRTRKHWQPSEYCKCEVVLETADGIRHYAGMDFNDRDVPMREVVRPVWAKMSASTIAPGDADPPTIEFKTRRYQFLRVTTDEGGNRIAVFREVSP